MNRSAWSLILAAIVLCVGIVQWVHPFSTVRIDGRLLIVAAVLLALRYFAVRQHERRRQMLDDVPKHPLGISDDDDR